MCTNLRTVTPLGRTQLWTNTVTDQERVPPATFAPSETPNAEHRMEEGAQEGAHDSAVVRGEENARTSAEPSGAVGPAADGPTIDAEMLDSLVAAKEKADSGKALESGAKTSLGFLAQIVSGYASGIRRSPIHACVISVGESTL